MFERAKRIARLGLLTLALLCPVHSAMSAAHAKDVASVWPAVTPMALDPSTEAFVADLLAHMTLEEKVGQMIQADIGSITPAELTQYKLGSILAGGGAAPDNNVRTTPQAWRTLTDELHRAALNASSAAHVPIPLLFGIDAVHGNSKLIGATVFPHNVGLGAMHDADLVRRIGAATAAEVAVAGIDWTFAPTVAVARDVRWGRSFESYSESPDLIAAYAPAMVEGLQGRLGSADFLTATHTLSSIKHFIGDGATRDGRDQGDAQISEAALSEIHGAGYAPALAAGAMIVMASYNSWNGVKVHGNAHLLTEVLKGRLGFQGFVVGDWNGHEQIPGCTKSDCAAAILAGVDMLMAPDSWKPLYANVVAQAKAGVIPLPRIDDAVRRILRVKKRAGLFERTVPVALRDGQDFAVLGSPEHRALARQAVRESLVLLKNNRATLPLRPGSQLLICGDLADDIGAQSGGWTIDWQGDHNRNTDFPNATSIFAGIKAAAVREGGSASLSIDGHYTRRPDVAVVVFGERPYAEFAGDRETLEFSPYEHRALRLLQHLRAAGIPTVSVFLSGRPLWVNRELNASDAFVASWLPGSEGEGIADLLFGKVDGHAVDFTGRLSFSWPSSAMPVRYLSDGRVQGALFARGFGLALSDKVTTESVSEDARIAPRYAAGAGSLYRAAHPTAPWNLFLGDGGEKVHATTPHALSPHAIVHADTSLEGSRITWSGGTEGVVAIAGWARDLSAQAQRSSVRLRYRLDSAPQQPVLLSLGCSEIHCGARTAVAFDLTSILRAAAAGRWHTLSIPLACFTAAGAQLTAVDAPFTLTTAGTLGLTIGEISLDPNRHVGTASCPPQFADM